LVIDAVSAGCVASSVSPVATWQATSTAPIGLGRGVTCAHFSIA
jgi:hypothetical protein